MKIKYDDVNKCPKCGGYNIIDIKDQIGPDICEAVTKCKECLHNDYWSYGFYKCNSIESVL